MHGTGFGGGLCKAMYQAIVSVDDSGIWHASRHVFVAENVSNLFDRGLPRLEISPYRPIRDGDKHTYRRPSDRRSI